MSKYTKTEKHNAIALDNAGIAQHFLDMSDWTQIPNSGLTSACVTAFDTYRQSLRTIRKTNPDNPTWPDAPTEEWS